MAGKLDSPAPELKPEERHERRDVDSGAVWKFGTGLGLICVISLILIVGVYKYLQKQENARQEPLQDGAIAATRVKPPEPRLQETPVADLKQIRDSEDQILGSYGWVDQQRGVVRIPIDRAIDLLAQRGLPSRKAEDAAKQPFVSRPTESGLGTELAPDSQAK